MEGAQVRAARVSREGSVAPLLVLAVRLLMLLWLLSLCVQWSMLLLL